MTSSYSHPRSVILALTLWASLFAQHARAQTIYSNYTAGSLGQFVNDTQLSAEDLVSVSILKQANGQFVTSGTSVATSFTAGLSGSVGSIGVPFDRIGGNPATDTRVQYLAGYLWSDNAGAPGTLLGTFTAPASASLDVNGVHASAVNFTASSPISVTQGATFWFSVSPATDLSGAYSSITQTNVQYYWAWVWHRTTNSGTILDANTASPTATDWTVHYANSTAGLIVSASAVPEPTTYAAVVGMAALGVALLRRRRKDSGRSA